MEFHIDTCFDNVYHPKTKEYFREVVSSFKNENYRSTIVMLYSVTICDLIFKLKEAADIYQDTRATEILAEINRRQEEHATDSSWEGYLIDEVCETTRLLDNNESENLRHLRKHRHLSAHPVLNQVDILFSPNPETALAHIRNTVDGILSKGALFSGDIFGQLLEDIANEKGYLADDQILKRYLESKYLLPMSTLLQNKVFKSLWRIVFKIEDAKCEENRDINYRTLHIMLERNSSNLISAIKDQSSYFSQISELKKIYRKLVNLIVNFPEIFDSLEAHAKEKLKAKIREDEKLIVKSYFLSPSVPDHFKYLADRYHEEENTPFETKYIMVRHGFDPNEIIFLRELGNSKGYTNEFYDLMINHYKHSTSYSTADINYDYCISPYLSDFNEKQMVSLLEAVNSNRQVHDTRRKYFSSEIKAIKARADELLGSEYQYNEKYPQIVFP